MYFGEKCKNPCFRWLFFGLFKKSALLSTCWGAFCNVVVLLLTLGLGLKPAEKGRKAQTTLTKYLFLWCFGKIGFSKSMLSLIVFWPFLKVRATFDLLGRFLQCCSFVFNAWFEPEASRKVTKGLNHFNKIPVLVVFWQNWCLAGFPGFSRLLKTAPGEILVKKEK